jgi:O-antigen/teichoic acid export membrane protein
LLRCTAFSGGVAVLVGFALIPFYGGPGAAYALLTAMVSNFVLVYVAVRRLVVEVPVHRQLAAPLAALGASMILYLALAEWNVWAALASGSALYVAGLVGSDGPRLASFLRTIVRKGRGSTLLIK